MNRIDDKMLEQLSKHIRGRIGLHFPPKKYGELRHKLLEMAREKGFKDINEFAESIIHEKDSKKQAEMLASKLSIGETYFWRDRELFRALEEEILPGLIEKKRRTKRNIRIWSAGSSTGEEAYSIAILFKELLTDLKDWNLSIIGTDINPESLEKARRGKYTEWSFRSAPAFLKERYFRKSGKNEYEISESIKRMVDFQYLNLKEDVFPSLTNNTNGMDLIFCRNVLMYFDLDDIRLISEKLYNCLLENGYLFTTPSESFQYLSPRFRLKVIRNISVYEKCDEREDASVSTKIEKTEKTEIQIYPRKIKKSVPRKPKPTKRVVKKFSENKPNEDGREQVQSLFSLGHYHQAEKILKEMLNGRDDQELLLLMARILANQGRLDEADDYCKQSLKINKLDPVSHYLHASIMAEKGNTAQAYQSLKTSFYLDSSFILTNYMLGNYAFQLNKTKESGKHFSNALLLLDKMEPHEQVPESDGITAERLKEIIQSTLEINQEINTEGGDL